MKVIENVKSKSLWPTVTFTFKVNNIDNEQTVNFAAIDMRIYDLEKDIKNLKSYKQLL